MTLLQGASGYFSRPQLILDPNLFERTTLHSDVRERLLYLFYNHMDTMFHNARNWSMLWLAGSGISYQWSGDRGNGDLDVLFGLDYTKFVSDNPEYRHYERAAIAEAMDDMLKRRLWPKTAHTPFGNNVYEVTYYLNPGTEDFDESIKNIHPYAAYNLNENHWTVTPMEPEEYGDETPPDYIRQSESNKQTADQLVQRYYHLANQLQTVGLNGPTQVNIQASKRLVVQEIKNMFDTIHLGRKQAFSNQGSGYGDFYNYQWQAAKRDGIVRTFNEILNREEVT